MGLNKQHTKTEPVYPQKLEVALLYNLAYFENTTGWKKREDIIKTDTQKTDLLRFSSDFANLGKILDRLVYQRLIEKKKVKFIDKRGRERSRWEYKLIQNSNVLDHMFKLSDMLDCLKLESINQEKAYKPVIPNKIRQQFFVPGSSYLQLFYNSDYFRTLPSNTKNSFLSQHKTLLKDAKNMHIDILNRQLEYFTRQASACFKQLKDYKQKVKWPKKPVLDDSTLLFRKQLSNDRLKGDIAFKIRSEPTIKEKVKEIIKRKLGEQKHKN